MGYRGYKLPYNNHGFIIPGNGPPRALHEPSWRPLSTVSHSASLGSLEGIAGSRAALPGVELGRLVGGWAGVGAEGLGFWWFSNPEIAGFPPAISRDSWLLLGCFWIIAS